ncbi:MAG: transcription elongation factor GreA, partial [Treponema sp.]|nr:transcription elongation factor GreA [Treponema sp.]
MSEELVKSVQEMLKEEIYTRATISNYTKNNLVELTGIVEKASSENCIAEIKSICDEHLTHTKDSIIALYISGMLGLKIGTLDNSALISLVDIFQKNHKETLIEYLCLNILSDDPNNKFALRTIAECYKEDSNEEKLWETYEKIVKLDFEEAELAKVLGKHYEDLGDKEKEVEYYKKALLRFIVQPNININILKEIWTKLISLIPEEIDFFYLVQNKIAKHISSIKSCLLLQDVYKYYKDNKKWNTSIEILKIMLEIDPKDNWARKEIEECFRGKYKKHSHLDEYIISSGIIGNTRGVFEAINDFEKHIAFDTDNFVFHRTWGVGKITEVDGDNLKINFGGKVGAHNMSLKMAVNALMPLSKKHIWVLKATKKLDFLKKKIKDDKEWTLKTIIKSFDNKCDFKRIKAELVPSILTTSEWTTWNSAAKKILEENSTFGVDPSDITKYIVRDHSISQSEKLANEFKAQKKFFERIDILMKYINAEDTDKESELLTDMISYFNGFLKAISSITESVVASYLVIQYISKKLPSLVTLPTFTFAELYSKIENHREMYEALKDTKNTSLRQDYLNSIKLLPNWADEYIDLFPTVLDKDMINRLVNAGYTEKVQNLVRTAFDNYRDYRKAIVLFFDKCQDEDWYKESGVTFEKQMITMVNIIALNYREIESHVNTAENKKVIESICNSLFRKDTMINYMLENGEDTTNRLYTLVNDVKGLDAEHSDVKVKMRNKILEKFPKFKFQETEEKSAAPKGLIVTAKMLEIKKALLEDLQSNQLPKIAEEVSEARAKGDLKENAEYIAAKEHQHYLQTQFTKLREELNRAEVFDQTTVTTSIISFGTKTVLLNNITGKEEEYT